MSFLSSGWPRRFRIKRW